MVTQIDRLKHIKIVVTKENLPIIHKYSNSIHSKEYEEKAQYIAICVTGEFIKKLGITKDIQDWYYYKLMLFRDQDALDADTCSPGLSATRAIKMYVNRLLEPKEEKVTRDPDMFLNFIYGNNELIEGHFVDIDMRSGEPYFLMKRVPELKGHIERLYEGRRKNANNKLYLVALNGQLRNTHVSIYKGVCKDLYNYMCWMWDELLVNGITPVAMRRDGIIAHLPYEGCKLPKSIKSQEGKNMGDLKIVYDSGKIRLGGYGFVFATNMKKITSKVQGMKKESILDKIGVITLRDGKIKLKVRLD